MDVLSSVTAADGITPRIDPPFSQCLGSCNWRHGGRNLRRSANSHMRAAQHQHFGPSGTSVFAGGGNFACKAGNRP